MRTSIATLVLAVAFAAAAVASIPELPDREQDGLDPRALVGFRKCEITEVRADRTIIVWDELDQATHQIHLSPKIKLRAAKKRQFDGRKKLVFEDLAEGQRVKVSFRKNDGSILQIDVLPETAE